MRRFLGYSLFVFAIVFGVAVCLLFFALDVLVVFAPDAQNGAEVTDIFGRKVEPMPGWIRSINPFERDMWPGWKWFFLDLAIGAVLLLIAYGLGFLGLSIARGSG